MSEHDINEPQTGMHEDVDKDDRGVDVPLREEEIRVERHNVTGGQVPFDAFQEQDIDIPIRGEEAEVTRTARVREEVNITKQVRERNNHDQ